MCMPNRIPLNSLNTFASAAEHLSFQQAAEFLFVTPSAVSHQIRNLEQILGYSLFDRLDKKVKLTSKGKQLFSDIQAPIKQLNDAGIKALRNMENNSLALSVSPVFATGWLLPRIKDFNASYPDINLSVIASSDLVDFNLDPFDASIRLGVGDWEGLVLHRLFGSEMVAACHPMMLDANKELFTPSELSSYPLINNSALPKLWDEWFQSANIKIPAKIDFKLEVQNIAQIIEAIQSGDSIGLIDRNFINNDIKSGRLAIACEHVLKGDAAYYLTTSKATESLDSFQAFKDWLDTQRPRHNS